MESTWQHTTVLLNEAVEALSADSFTKPDATYVDATFGRGGHSRLILSRLSPLGQQVIAHKSGHFPQLTEPGVVLQVLHELVQEAALAYAA